MKSLIVLVFENSTQELREALKQGATVDMRDSDGRTPLIHASIDNKLAIAQALLEAGADVNTQDRLGNSSLHYAAQEHHLEIARLLLDRGEADVDIEDLHGNTPLWRAVFNSRGQGELISLLLAAGADRNHQNKRGKSPSELAKTIANYDIAKFFT